MEQENKEEIDVEPSRQNPSDSADSRATLKQTAVNKFLRFFGEMRRQRAWRRKRFTELDRFSESCEHAEWNKFWKYKPWNRRS